MSDNYVPQVGDTVNITLNEAKVTEVDAFLYGWHLTVTGHDTGEDRKFYISNLLAGTQGGATIALVRPAAPATLPTTPGSIVRYKHDATELYVRVDGGWYDIDEKCVTERTLRPNLYEVVFDAGADR